MRVRLHAEVAGSGPWLVLLHGFTGSTRSWDGVIDRLRQIRRVAAVDLPGHGRSEAPADATWYRAEQTVAAVLALWDRLGIDRCDLLGYSMGGRAALHLALAAPMRIRSLILESGSPGIADPSERTARIAADESLAARIEREGMNWFAAHWESLPLFASQASLPESTRATVRERRLANDPNGLANSLRGFGAGVPEPLWGRLGELPRTLLLTGELDEKYVHIARAMAARMPDAAIVTVPGAGHCVHLEQPEAFLEAVEDFLVPVMSGNNTSHDNLYAIGLRPPT
jgi:2-succinyl-6-hydroxy-2,4-cyclohexadiene-1-carboxylate synthase